MPRMREHERAGQFAVGGGQGGEEAGRVEHHPQDGLVKGHEEVVALGLFPRDVGAVDMHGGCDAAFALAFPVAFLLEIVPEVGALFRNVLRGGRLAFLGLGFGGLGSRRGGVMVARNTGDHRSGRQRIVAVQIRRQGAPGGSRLRGGSGCGRLVDNGRSVRVAETETVLAMRAGRHRRIGGNGVLVYLAFKPAFRATDQHRAPLRENRTLH